MSISNSNTRTVILGEASEESDCEEISLTETNTDTSKELVDQKISNDFINKKQSDEKFMRNEQPIKIEQNGENHRKANIFSSSLLASINSATSIARLVNSSAYNLLLQSTSSQTKPFEQNNFTNNKIIDDVNEEQQLPLLHKTLYLKNQQLYACMNHLYKQPYEKATKSFNSISQRLVCLQKNIQDIDNATTRIRRERKNLNIDINLIA